MTFSVEDYREQIEKWKDKVWEWSCDITP